MTDPKLVTARNEPTPAVKATKSFGETKEVGWETHLTGQPLGGDRWR